MRQIPPALLQHLKEDNSSLAICWAIEKKNGQVIRGTEHDRDLSIPVGSPDDYLSGTYYSYANISGSDIDSSGDMSVDNLEVDGALQSSNDTVITDVTVEEIEAGLLNKAPVTVLVMNWRRPEDGYFIVRRGFLGEINWDSDNKYKTEVRGLVQLFSQTIIQTYSERCNVQRFGDSRCKKDVAAITITVTALTVTNNKAFSTDDFSGSPLLPVDYFTGGVLRGLTGENSGFEREVKSDNNGSHGNILLWDEMPKDIQTGDTFALEPGCNRLLETCRDVHNNLANFRGYGVFIPGVMALVKGPG